MLRRLRLGSLALAPLLMLACAKSPKPVSPPSDAAAKVAPVSGAGAKSTAQAESSAPKPSAIPTNGWTEEERVAHVLSRLAFGPRPGDVERIAGSGLEAWMRAQLAPAKAGEAPNAKLDALPATKMSVSDTLDAYVPKKKQMPGDADMTPAHLAREIGAQKILRAIESDRQFEEVMVDFWFNHFNVDAKKGATQWMTLAYERDAIRANVFGTFRGLLAATARHPAMLFYLDNWLSSGEPAMAGGKKGKKRGLNENYGRELLELHTLGVDGGYDQADVREVARAFTGWTIEKPRAVGTFVFRPGMHDVGAKTVLGTSLSGGGVGDGERVLDLVAAHPSTARFIATKLCRRLVSDDPPKELIDEVARVFKESAGDLRATYEAIVFSKHFWADAAKKSKVKDPFELAVSSVRAVGGTIVLDTDSKQSVKLGPGVAVEPLVKAIDGMGEPIYRCAPPTGYKEIATAWVGTGALVARIKFALALAEGRYGKAGHGVVFDATKLVDPALAHGEDGGALVDAVTRAVLHGSLAPATRAAIVAEIEKLPAGAGDDEVSRRRLATTLGLVLGSPEFQRQ